MYFLNQIFEERVAIVSSKLIYKSVANEEGAPLSLFLFLAYSEIFLRKKFVGILV